MCAAAHGRVGGRIPHDPCRRTRPRSRLTAPRLATRTWVSALLRRVHAAGDFATVIARGDDVAGSVIIVHRDRAGLEQAFQRVLAGDDGYRWRIAASGESVAAWIAAQRRFDPDIWVVELDTADPARFVDEMTG